MRKILPADTLTPILAYMRVQGEHKVILESIPREKENARFSIIAYNPVFEVTFKDGVLYENGKAIDQDPFEYLDQVTVKGIKSDLPFAGGAIGFAGYDMIGLYENIGEIPEDTIGTPDMHFFIYESYLIFDHKKEKVYVVEDNIYSGRDNDAVRQALGQVVTILQTQAPNEFTPQALQALQFSNHIEKEVFMDMVAKAKKLIREGDMFQCVLSQRFSADFEGDPLDYYRNLRVTNPSNYLYFYDFGDYVNTLLIQNNVSSSLIAEFEKQLNLLIPHKTNTDKFFTASRGPIKIHTYSGITTSDPSKSQRANSKTSTKWYYATH